MVDVASWDFSERSNFHVGPVVGRVTSNSGRLVVESKRDCTATIDVEVGGEQVINSNQVQFLTSKTLKAEQPTGIEISGLPSGQRVKIHISLDGEKRTASFTTPGDQTTWNIGLVSCNSVRHNKTVGMWEKLAQRVLDIHCVIHMGDQVYGDDDIKIGKKVPASGMSVVTGVVTAGHTATVTQPPAEDSTNGETKNGEEKPESCWERCENIMKEHLDRREDWAALKPQLLGIYREIYRITWNYPPTATVLASTSNLMMLDDHEIVDDLGDHPPHKDPNSWEFFVMGIAYQVFLEYQHQLAGPVADVTDINQKLYYHLPLLPGVGLFMLDVRLQKCLHRTQQTDWEGHEYLGLRQMRDLKVALNEDFADTNVVIMMCPTPPFFLNRVAASLLKNVADDVLGCWTNPVFHEEHMEFIKVLEEWQRGRPNRAITIVAGDVHIGGFGQCQLRDGTTTVLNEVTSSAIGNMPEGDPAKKSRLTTALLNASDAHTSMNVIHSEWLLEPNYGVLEITPKGPNETSRPVINAELVSKSNSYKHTFTYEAPPLMTGFGAGSCAGCSKGCGALCNIS